MINKNDTFIMENDIIECIDDWDYPMILIVPKPIKDQPNYNKIMREFDGPMEFDEYNINGEYRSKAENKQLNVDASGDSMKDKSIIILPSTFKHGNVIIQTIELLDQHTIIKTVLDEYVYRIASIRSNIGQISVEVIRLVGNEYKGDDFNGYN